MCSDRSSNNKTLMTQANLYAAFCPAQCACVTISLGGMLPYHSCSLPGARMKRAASYTCLTLLRLGVAWRFCYQNPGGLLHTPFHPYRKTIRRFVSVVLSRKLLSSGCYPAICSTECGRSSVFTAVTRLT